MDHKVHRIFWSGDRKIWNWDRVNFYDLLKQITHDEIEIMNGYLDSEGFDLKGLNDTHAEYVEDVLFTYIKDWLRLLIEADSIDQAKELFAIYSAAMATRKHN